MLGWMRRGGERDVASYVSTAWPFLAYMPWEDLKSYREDLRIN
jgi:hypothetical protein